MYELTIDLTLPDIRNGHADCWNHPVARAIRRYFGKAYDVNAGTSYCYVYFPWGTIRLWNDAVADAFLSNGFSVPSVVYPSTMTFVVDPSPAF
jgi:hypothetical protein